MSDSIDFAKNSCYESTIKLPDNIRDFPPLATPMPAIPVIVPDAPVAPVTPEHPAAPKTETAS